MEKGQDMLGRMGISEDSIRRSFEKVPTESLKGALETLQEEELAVVDENGTKVQTEPFDVMGAELDELAPIATKLQKSGLPVNIKTLTEAVRSTRKLKIKVMSEILSERK